VRLNALATGGKHVGASSITSSSSGSRGVGGSEGNSNSLRLRRFLGSCISRDGGCRGIAMKNSSTTGAGTTVQSISPCEAIGMCRSLRIHYNEGLPGMVVRSPQIMTSTAIGGGVMIR